MTPVRTTCPNCGEITQLATTEIFALHDGDGTTGDYSYTCPQCTRTGVHPATRTAVAEPLSAGIVPIEGSDMSNTTVTRPARTTMHAILQNRYGTSEVLHPAQIERPDIGADEVLVQVRVAGLSRAAVSA